LAAGFLYKFRNLQFQVTLRSLLVLDEVEQINEISEMNRTDEKSERTEQPSPGRPNENEDLIPG